MKKLFLTIIIFLIPLSYSLANTIEDFEIEGVSIGESLLDYATEDEIKSINAGTTTRLINLLHTGLKKIHS